MTLSAFRKLRVGYQPWVLEPFQVQGGGNAANALVAAARLGARPVLWTKLGGDAAGDAVLAELQSEGVDTSCVARGPPGSASPSTYILVDRTNKTRTCIHTPGPELQPHDVAALQAAAAGLLADCGLAYFDGRLADAALPLATAARAAGVPVLVEAERLRPGLEDLLQARMAAGSAPPRAAAPVTAPGPPPARARSAPRSAAGRRGGHLDWISSRLDRRGVARGCAAAPAGAAASRAAGGHNARRAWQRAAGALRAARGGGGGQAGGCALSAGGCRPAAGAAAG